MRRLHLLVVFAALAGSDMTSAEMGEETKSAALIVDRQDGFRLPVRINETPFTVRVVPVIGAARIVSSDVAKRLGLKGGMVKGRADIGPVRLVANSGSVRIDYGQLSDAGRIFWFDGPAAFALDGEFAPGSLPFVKVTFRLNPPTPREETISLEMEPLSMSGLQGRNAVLTVGGERVKVGFDLNRRETIVPASTGVLLAQNHRGQLTGSPRSAVIEYGIVRPVRPMILADPLPIGGLRLADVLVRVSDFGDAASIPDGQKIDENEIVVTAKSKRKPKHGIVFGTDFLDRCSQLTYDFRSMKVLLSCRTDSASS